MSQTSAVSVVTVSGPVNVAQALAVAFFDDAAPLDDLTPALKQCGVRGIDSSERSRIPLRAGSGVFGVTLVDRFPLFPEQRFVGPAWGSQPEQSKSGEDTRTPTHKGPYLDSPGATRLQLSGVR